MDQFYGAIIWYHLMAPFYGMCVPGLRKKHLQTNAKNLLRSIYHSARNNWDFGVKQDSEMTLKKNNEGHCGEHCRSDTQLGIIGV